MYIKLIEERRKKGLSQGDIANYLGISKFIYNLKEQQKVSEKFDKGEIYNDFTIVEANKILEILNKKYEDIFLP